MHIPYEKAVQLHAYARGVTLRVRARVIYWLRMPPPSGGSFANWRLSTLRPLGGGGTRRTKTNIRYMRIRCALYGEDGLN